MVKTHREPQRPEIFYFGRQFDFLKTASRPDEDLVFLPKSQDSLRFINNSRAAVLMAAVSADEVPEALSVLERFEQESPRTTRILIVEGLTAEIFKKAVNQAHIHICADLSDFNQRWKELLNKGVDQYHQANVRAQLMRESTRQFRELEALNLDLEKIVHERTQHIETSKVEEEEKLNKVRSLIRLIKDLAHMTSFEELLLLLRKEVRKFHKVGDPILIYQASADRVDFVSLQSGQILFTHKKGSFPFAHEILISGTEMSRALANHFGRPFIKTLYIPLEPGLMKNSSFPGAQAGVCLEVSLGESEIGQFLDFIRERAQSIAITVDRLMLETELVQFSYRWEKTFDGFRDPIAIVDLEYEVLRSNKKFSDKIIRKKCFESFARKEDVCEGCPVQKAMASGLPQRGQIQVDTKIFEVHSYPILLEGGGQITNVVNQYVDITLSRELYLRMLQSEKMGAIGLLAGHIAHELNNPLTGLRSLSQVLIATTPEGDLKSDLQEIEKATGRSQQIIRNLLDFSAEGEQATRLTTFDQIVEKTLPMLKAVMRIHRQEFELDTKEDFIEVEPHLLQQVFFNLVNNACQAMKDPGILSVRSFVEDSRVILQVEDTGPGIPENIREKIFEPFFTTKKEGLGTGLGLSLTKKIVESFGGQIRLKSEIGKGSMFEVSLPVATKVVDPKGDV
jgi:two-component system, NtrC family, sensor kinase